MDTLKKFTNLSWLKNKKIQNCLMVLALGIILLIAGDALFANDEEAKSPQKTMTAVEAYGKADETEVEARLGAVLSKIKGAGEVAVMVQFSGGSESVLGTDTKVKENITEETDASGGSRKVTETEREEDTVLAGNAPVTIKEYAPRVQGVIVVAEGGGDERVREALKEAAATVLGISGYKVQVFEKETNHKGGLLK